MKSNYPNEPQFIEQLKTVELLINANKLPEAVQQLNQLGKIAPQDPRLFLLASRLAEASGNGAGMLDAARRAHQLAPQWATATVHLAAVLAAHDMTDETLAMCALAVQQEPLNPEVWSRSAGLALRLNAPAKALEWFRQAQVLNPGDDQLQLQIGLALNAAKDFSQAIDVFTELLTRAPTDTRVLGARQMAYLATNQLALAILDAETLIQLEPDVPSHQFFLACARGETPATQPESVIKDLFDRYAVTFDQHLVSGLKYKLPQHVAQMILLWHPDRKGHVLDLGCGTGLLGASLGPIDGALVGVDLSGEMIKRASRHRVYDKFHEVNLIDALRDTPGEQYDVIVSLEVFIYIGDLEQVIINAHRILIPGGHFVFSCEAGQTGSADYALQKSYRYTHQRDYLQRLLECSGFTMISIEDWQLRYSAGKPVDGYLVTAVKPTEPVLKKAKRSKAPVSPALPT